MTKRSCLPILAAFLTVVQLLNPAFAQAATGAIIRLDPRFDELVPKNGRPAGAGRARRSAHRAAGVGRP
jgi:hypothetical protein